MFRYSWFAVLAVIFVASRVQGSSSSEIDTLRWILKHGEDVEILKTPAEGGPLFDDNDDEVLDLQLDENDRDHVKSLLDEYYAGKMDKAENDAADLDPGFDDTDMDTGAGDSDDVDAEFEADAEEGNDSEADLDVVSDALEDDVVNGGDLGRSAIHYHKHAYRYAPVRKGRVTRRCSYNRFTRTRKCCINQKMRVFLFNHYLRFRFNSCVSMKYVNRYHVYSMTFTVGRNVLEQKLVTMHHLQARCYRHKNMRFCLRFTNINYRKHNMCARLKGMMFLSPYHIRVNTRIGCFRMPYSRALNATRQSYIEDLGAMDDDDAVGRQIPENSVEFESLENQSGKQTAGAMMMKGKNPVLNLILRKKREQKIRM